LALVGKQYINKSGDSEFKHIRKTFLSRMNELMSWDQLEAAIGLFYPKPGNGKRPYLLSTMFRIDCMQHWYNMSDPSMEDVLYEIMSMRLFADLSLDNPISDHTIIFDFVQAWG
jgi:IS5 family transposase